MPKFTVEERLSQRLKRSKANVFLRRDFDKLGGYDQVGRAPRQATQKGTLIKAGYGVYVKARESSLSGKPVPVISLVEVGLQALEKLEVKADVGSAARAYRDGVSTQLPMAAVLSVGKARVSRRLGFGNKTIRYEKIETHFQRGGNAGLGLCGGNRACPLRPSSRYIQPTTVLKTCSTGARRGNATVTSLLRLV